MVFRSTLARWIACPSRFVAPRRSTSRSLRCRARGRRPAPRETRRGCSVTPSGLLSRQRVKRVSTANKRASQTPSAMSSEPPESRPSSQRSVASQNVGLAMASPQYPSARRRFRVTVIILLAGGFVLAVFLPGWWGPIIGAIVGIGGTGLAAWLFRRAGERLEKDMRGWLREKTITGLHVPGDDG